MKQRENSAAGMVVGMATGAVLGAAGVDAHAHGHCRVRRLAGIRAGKSAAGRVLAAVGLSDGADDPGAAPVLRPCHAGATRATAGAAFT